MRSVLHGILCTYLPVMIGLLAAERAVASVIHVPSEYSTIQSGIDAALAGDTVLVSQGTYSGSGNTDLDYHGKSIHVVSESGPEMCVIDCEGMSRGIAFRSGEGNDAYFAGFTIYHGEAQGIPPEDSGGGILCRSASPVIDNCRIVLCSAQGYGGGICVDMGSPVVLHTVVLLNSALTAGGGCYFTQGSPQMAYCRISNNICDAAGGGIAGGNSTWLTMSVCQVSYNAAELNGAGLYFFRSFAAISGSEVTENVSLMSGGGVYLEDSDVTLSNCRIGWNISNNSGGGIFAAGDSGLTVDTTWVFNNESSYAGAGICLDHCQSAKFETC
ncbi:right-handed parallel beta-helix repeat-containing protein, partial [bacterium]|nr:right-handed parallel beta-helix repeat-containing protein [candidate division CSSED10-310 bacterium]